MMTARATREANEQFAEVDVLERKAAVSAITFPAVGATPAPVVAAPSAKM